jgi:hypothetical protein
MDSVGSQFLTSNSFHLNHVSNGPDSEHNCSPTQPNIHFFQVQLADARQKLLEEKAKKKEVQSVFQNKIKNIEEDIHRQYNAKEHKVGLSDDYQ